MKIGDKVRVNESYLFDFPACTDRVGEIVGVSEEGCIHGETYDVEFESGNTDWFYPYDLEIVESESPYEEELNEDEVYELLERAQAVGDEHAIVSR